jgi:hypothetical protein
MAAKSSPEAAFCDWRRAYVVQSQAMAEEEKGAKWWFRYVIVPIIGGGGAIAVITAYIAKPSESTPATSTVTAPQESHPGQPGTQPAKPSFNFKVNYDPRTIRGSRHH